jgi:hypothetical protein
MQLLDALQEKLTQIPPRDERIEVFDVDSFTSMADFDKFIPGIGPVYHTPAVGVWHNGVFEEKASGVTARELIYTRFRLSH